MTDAPPARDRGLRALDGLRGLAAFEVLAGHAIFLLASEAAPRAGRPWWGWVQVALAHLFRHGRSAVVCFFVLSGVVIHLRLAAARQRGEATFDRAGYCRRRVVRLYPALLAALLFTAAVDAVGKRVEPSFYLEPAPSGSGAPLAKFDHSAGAFVGNLVFLQGLVVRTFGSDIPLWSLAFEGVIYLLYPLAFVPLYRRSPRAAFAVSGGFGLAGLVLWAATGSVWGSALGYAVFWLLGALLAEIYVAGRRWRGGNLALALALFGLAGLAALWGRLPDGLGELLWSLGFAGAILALLVARDAGLVARARTLLGAAGALGACSYTLYLFHYPLLNLFGAALRRWQGAPPVHYGWAALGAAACLALAAAVAPRLENVGRT
jgi:peptidoglycan/LPS O-acetylase OafA/YrhL